MPKRILESFLSVVIIVFAITALFNFIGSAGFRNLPIVPDLASGAIYPIELKGGIRYASRLYSTLWIIDDWALRIGAVIIGMTVFIKAIIRRM